MKQTNLIFCAAFAMGMTACTNENNDSLVNNYSDDITAVRISAPDFIYTGQTRTDFIIDESGAKFIWAENDTVGIFPGKGDQISFPMTSGAGANSASFTGGDWALKESGTYYAYYPFDRWNFASYDKKNNIEVSYVGQAQDGNDSTKDLGKYDFMAAAETASVNGALNLNFEHLGCLLKIEVKAPAAGSYKELSLNLNESLFTTKAKIDLQTSPIVLSSLATANSLSLNLKNVSVTEGETIVCYMMIAPVDLSETTLTLTLKDESGKAFNSEVEGKEYVAGKIYLLGADVANEDISTKVVTLTEPGTLMEKIGGISGALETVNLTLTGPLCGTDIKIIRSMPNLKRLDIENVEFVIANENEAYYNNHKLMPINDLYTNKEYITGERIFAELKTLETVKWSKLTNTIFPYAFNSCGKLSTVIIPDNITLIEEHAFESCSNLNQINLPPSLKRINPAALNITNLESVIIPNGVEYIGYWAFAQSFNIKTIYIPNTVQFIGERAFSYGYSIEDIYFHPKSENVILESFIFGDMDQSIYANAKFHIPTNTSINDWFLTDIFHFKNVISDLDPQG